MMSDAEQTLKDRKSRPQTSPFLKVSLWCAISVHILVFLFFHVRSGQLSDRGSSKPYVTFVSEDSFAKDAELEEYAMLFDSAPLFIPTRWNASQLVEVDFETVSMSHFSEFEPPIELLKELQPEGLLITDDYRIDEPSNLLNSRFWRFFEGFGQSAETASAFESVAPVAEVYVIGESRPALSLNVDLEPVASFSALNPVSYAIRRSNNGLVWGAPTLVESSGNEAFDQSVARWLQRPEVLSRLPVGYLSVRVFFW